MAKRILALLVSTALVGGCSLSPDFKLPDIHLPDSYKEQPRAEDVKEMKGNWKPAESLEKSDRGQWWLIFGDETLNELEKQAQDANQSLKAAAARVEEARATARANTTYFLPNLDIGANAVRAQPATAPLAAFGQTATGTLKPYTLYSAQGTLSYEADLFGRVRDTEHAFKADADAQAAMYRSTLLALQGDVAQTYFSLRALDSERQLLKDTVKIREKAQHIMQHQYDVGESGEQDLTRMLSELASSKADLAALDRQRSVMEHAMAVLLGKMPSEFSMAEAPLEGVPPAIPAGLPSSLLQRRPDIASAQSVMAAANARIGVARTAFFPEVILTATGGFESIKLADLFKWSNRTWALGQLAGSAITMPIFDSGHNFARLDVAHAAYDEAVAAYRQQVLVAFRDVEDSLTGQRLLAEQSSHQDAAAAASSRTLEVVQKRYHEGDLDFFQVVDAERESLAMGRAAVQLRGQRFVTTINLIRALGGGWDGAKLEPAPEDAAKIPDAIPPSAAPAAEQEKPAVQPLAPKASEKK